MTDVKTIAGGWQPDRVTSLRQAMSAMALDALVVPRWDEQQFEYVSVANERLAWLTGFTGSWGLAVVTHNDVILFIDGRYPEQAARETSAEWVTIQHLYEQPPEDWLKYHAQTSWRIGFDSEVMTPDLQDRLLAACEQKGALIQPTSGDPFEHCWLDQCCRIFKMTCFPVSGRPVVGKLGRVREQMRLSEADWLIETQPDNVNWLLNIRGQDLPYCPVVRTRPHWLGGRNPSIR